MTKAFYVLAPFISISMLVAFWVLIMCGVAHAGSTGQPIDLSPDAEGFQIWYTIGAEGWASSSDEVEVGGSFGQAIIGSPNSTSDDPWVTSGFWAPGVSYDSTDVDPTDSTDVAVAVLGIDDPVDGPIAGFALAPVWPNPSHGIAYIRWTVPRASNVRLTVLDVQGREAERLADGNVPAGRYGVRWNARGGGVSASGIYFVRLETPDGVFTRRVAIIR